MLRPGGLTAALRISLSLLAMSHLLLSIVGESKLRAGNTTITPSASHLFALVLLLSLSGGHRLSRLEVQDMLFPDANTARLGAQSLRQLLYRLRRMGIQFDERPTSIGIAGSDTDSALRQLNGTTALERASRTIESLRILPGYSPQLSAAFTEWLDRLRDDLEGRVRRLLMADLTILQEAHSWREVASLSETLTSLDPCNDLIVQARAEALAMLGHRNLALACIDAFLRNEESLPSNHDLTRLRLRLLKPAPRQRQGLLRGRAQVLSLINEDWGLSAEGGARLFVTLGAAGIGKTRVADEFANRVKLTGARVIRYNCDLQSRSYPLAAFSAILPELRSLRGAIGVSEASNALLDRLRPTLAQAPVAIPKDRSLEQHRADIQSALVDLLEAVTVERRIVLLIDDAHFLDEASCTTIQSLCTSVNSASLLILTCCRPRDHALRIIKRSRRLTFHVLGPLEEQDSRALVQEASPDRHDDSAYIDWCVSQSAGNPFYLRAVAQCRGGEPATVPFDIHSLAASSYFGLGATERLVLECCLLLGRFASPSRVGAVADLADLELIAALRTLEEQDLICLVDATVEGPHALLDDAIRRLVPRTVATILNRRIAKILSDECMSKEYSSSLALAAAESWLEAGDASSAVSLVQRCAAEAAALGEPAIAADLISRMTRATLPAATRKELLDDAIRYAESGGDWALATDCLSARLLLARELKEANAVVRQLELKIIDANILGGGELSPAVHPLFGLLDNPDTEVPVRFQAVVSLLVVADAECDETLAEKVRFYLEDDPTRYHIVGNDALRACLVFNTVFGANDRALAIIQELTTRFPYPTSSDDCRKSRRFAALSLYRMLRLEAAKTILEADFAFVMEQSYRTDAFYAASLLTEIAFSEGNISSAARWLGQTESMLRGVQAHKLSPHSGYYTSAALLAIIEGRYFDAEKFLEAPQNGYARMRTVRYEAICTALRIRLNIAKGETTDLSALSLRLGELYLRGRCLGGQDTVVESLWSADTLLGRSGDAAQLLREYLFLYRREPSPPECFLRQATGADGVWVEWNRHGRPLGVAT
ncbi:MAG: hypothetical protein JWM95_5337 [Gemmatimonadetes bacterium]|nr:hypothetical protein [Gemmatimonadota bacterium]